MAKEHNLFNCPTFVSIWNKHFYSSGKVYRFDHLSNVAFIKSWGNLYVNVGKRITQGVEYSYNPDANDYPEKNQTFLIYDVPRFQRALKSHKNNTPTKILSSSQYKAYAANLKPYRNIEDYLKNVLSQNSRYQIKRAVKRFNHSFDIKLRFFKGPSNSSNEYRDLIKKFFALLDKRYQRKGERHVFQLKKNKTFISELLIPLLENDEAVFFGIYADGELVSLNLYYISNNALVLVLPLYDPDFSRFKVGHISTYYSLKWCIDNSIHLYDFSKGHYDYKRQWSNIAYEFCNHLIYNQKSLHSAMVAYTLFGYFELKRKLRSIGIDKIIHTLRNLKKKSIHQASKTFRALECPNIPDQSMQLLPLNDIKEIPGLMEFKNNFLFTYQEINAQTKCFLLKDNRILIQGAKNNLILTSLRAK